MKVDNIKPHVDLFVFPVVTACSQADLQIWVATSHPSFEMSLRPFSFTKQVLVRLDLLRYWEETTSCKNHLFRCAEVLFQPGYQSNMKCDVYIRKELCAMSFCQMARPCSK